jgi:hypothetical protein
MAVSPCPPARSTLAQIIRDRPISRPDAYQSFPAVAARQLYQSTDSCSN